MSLRQQITHSSSRQEELSIRTFNLEAFYVNFFYVWFNWMAKKSTHVILTPKGYFLACGSEFLITKNEVEASYFRPQQEMRVNTLGVLLPMSSFFPQRWSASGTTELCALHTLQGSTVWGNCCVRMWKCIQWHLT